MRDIRIGTAQFEHRDGDVAYNLEQIRKLAKRAAEQGWTSVLYESSIRIPFGTALLEETAFRSVLLAVVVDGWGWTWGVVVSSIVFGFWHVLPAFEFHENNEAAAGVLGEGWRAKATSVA